MTGIFLVLILVFLIIIYAFFKVMVAIGVAGVNPARLLAGLSKKKADANVLRNALRKDSTIQHWRTAVGILFGLIMLFIFPFSDQALMRRIYPMVLYVFVPLVVITVIVFIILAIKEQRFKRKYVYNKSNTADRQCSG